MLCKYIVEVDLTLSCCKAYYGHFIIPMDFATYLNDTHVLLVGRKSFGKGLIELYSFGCYLSAEDYMM